MNPAASLEDRRKAARKHVTFPAWIESTHNEQLACEVIDMTLSGARIAAPDTALPHEFTLLLDEKSSLKRRCKVVWRDGFTVGLEFVQDGATPSDRARA